MLSRQIIPNAGHEPIKAEGGLPKGHHVLEPKGFSQSGFGSEAIPVLRLLDKAHTLLHDPGVN